MIEYLGQLYQDIPMVVFATLGVMAAALIGAAVGTVMSGLIASARARRALSGELEGAAAALSEKIDPLVRELAHLVNRIGALEDGLQAQGSPDQDVRFKSPGGDDETTPRAWPALGEAAQALANGRSDDAEARYRNILERDTAEGEAAYGRAATAARRLGDMAYPADPKKALAAYRQAVILDPGNPEGWNMVGLLLQRAGELNEARQAFERVLELGGKSGNQRVVAAATGNLGLIAQERGDLEKAETHMLDSLTLHEELAMDEGIAAASGNLGGLYNARGLRPGVLPLGPGRGAVRADRKRPHGGKNQGPDGRSRLRRGRKQRRLFWRRGTRRPSRRLRRGLIRPRRSSSAAEFRGADSRCRN